MKNNQQMPILLTALTALLLGGCSAQTSANSQASSHTRITNHRVTAHQLAQVPFKSGQNPVLKVNHNYAQVSPKWHYDHIQYHHLDALHRIKSATAYLDYHNLGHSAGRLAQSFQPTGWHDQPVTVNQHRIFPVQNRGHLIAYTLTYNLNAHGQYQPGALGSSNNPYNLATQTDFSNKNTMQDYEQRVREALEAHKKVIYRVQPVFKGRNLMPSGYWSQARSTDGLLNFNVYLFNVEPLVKFNYATGRPAGDAHMKASYQGQHRDTSTFSTIHHFQTYRFRHTIGRYHHATHMLIRSGHQLFHYMQQHHNQG